MLVRERRDPWPTTLRRSRIVKDELLVPTRCPSPRHESSPTTHRHSPTLGRLQRAAEQAHSIERSW